MRTVLKEYYERDLERSRVPTRCSGFKIPPHASPTRSSVEVCTPGRDSGYHAHTRRSLDGGELVLPVIAIALADGESVGISKSRLHIINDCKYTYTHMKRF